MTQRKRTAESGTVSWTRAACGAVLACAAGFAWAAPSALAASSPARHASLKHRAKAAKLTQQQRVVHALDRFTFGARPRDVANVERIGLNAWFEQQLHPERFQDTAWQARLDHYPAMELSQTELLERFPPREALKAFDRGALSSPGDPVERAIYADAAFDQQEKKELKAAKAGTAGVAPKGAGPKVMPGIAATTAASSMAAPNGAQGVPAGAAEDGPEPMDPARVHAVLAMPPEQRFKQLVAMSPETMQSFRKGLRGPGLQLAVEGLSPGETEEAVAMMQRPERVVTEEVMATRLLEDVYSERQLQAVMTDFWLNHFNIYLRKNGNEPYLLPAFARETIQPHALGHFEDLLVATAESPAMLVYLDNVASIGPDSRAAERGPTKKGGQKGINENYARELMELHTLGVNGGYTQQDVIEVAKCFTGWTTERPDQGAGFVFNQNRHDPGPKTVLGHVIQEGGEQEGLEVLHLLATSPATAHFLSLELAQRFVSDQPPAALVSRMAATYMKTDGDIAEVLRAMYRSPEFWTPAVFRAKVKTPLEFVVSALRASGANVMNPMPLVQAMERLGMPVYGMQTPNGYSWTADAWVSSNALLTRMNFALLLSANRLPGTRLDWPGELGEADPQAPIAPNPAVEAHLEALLLEEPAAEQTRTAVLAQAGNPDTVPAAEQSFRDQAESEGIGANKVKLRPVKSGKAAGTPLVVPGTPLDTMAGLLLGSPDFQRR